jgi:DNA-binding PadR family transcriptional regulator
VALKHAVLGLLVPRPNYGHMLATLLEGRLGPGFVIDSGTIYASLRNLENEGHVRVVRRDLRGHQVRVWYEITPSGVRHFEEWIDAPLSREPLRADMFLRFAMTELPRVPALRLGFEQLERECLTEIASCTRVDLVGTLPDPVTWDAAMGLLLQSGVLDRLNAERSFIRRALSVLRWAEAEGVLPRDMLLKVVEAST